MEKDKAYVLHILDEIDSIGAFVAETSFDAFVSDLKTTKAVERSLGIIGEAAKHLSGEFCRSEPDIPWKNIAGIRDKIIHHYFDVDHSIVWDVIQNDLPKLQAVLEKYK